MAREVTLPGVWAEDAQTEIPPVPVSGDTYRNTDLSEADAGQLVKFGQKVDSANWNEYMFRLSSLVRELEQQGLLAYSPQTLYKAGGIAFHEGVLYQTPNPVSGVTPPNAPWAKFMPEGISSAVQSATIGGVAVTKSGTQLQLPKYPSTDEYVQKAIVLYSGQDLNTVVVSGFYRLHASVLNGPDSLGVTSSYAQMIVSRGGDTIAQILISYNTNRVAFRKGQIFSETISTAWIEFAMKGDIPTMTTLFPTANANPQYFIVCNGDYAQSGYTTLAQAKTVLAIPSFSLSGTTLTITP